MRRPYGEADTAKKGGHNRDGRHFEDKKARTHKWVEVGTFT